MTEERKPRVLFLCTGNSCRSQMAEGWARHFHAARLEACSAGVETHGLNPRAVQVMAEAGVDISGHRSQHVDEFADVPIELVVTVCDHAAEVCPVFPGRTRKVHRSFSDPAKAIGDEESVLAEFRRVRDEVREWVRALPELLEDAGSPVPRPGDG
ncbi:arsenate reductase ArsC [bacterium]|nr:arsenate reductase ArsC [bacterium]